MNTNKVKSKLNAVGLLLFLQVAATKIQATYRGYSQRKLMKKEASNTAGHTVPSSVAETGSGEDAGTNTNRPDDGVKISSTQVKGNKTSDPPKQDQGKSDPSAKEDKQDKGSATKEANQSAVPPPPAKAEANHTPKEPSKETTKGTKKK